MAMKLYYIDLWGRAAPIKLILDYAGAKYEDVRLTRAEWPQHRDRFELKQIPVLEDNGRMYNQSYAIMEYLGAKYNLLPASYEELHRVIFVMNTAEDLFLKAYMCLTPFSSLTVAEKEAGLKKVLDEDGPLLLGAIERKLKENCSKDFIVGCKYTIADFYLLGLYASIINDPDWSKAFEERIRKKYPLLQAYADKRMVDFNPHYKKCKTKVHYFDMPGRGEMVRILLKHMKMPFEDVRIKMEDWGKLKTSGKYELQQLPIVECEPCGVNICQTDAIMHRIGARYGYLPMKCPEKLYKVVWWCNTLKDVMDNCARLAFAPIPEEKKKQMRGDFFAKTLPVFLGAMQERLKSNKCQCLLVGKSYTIADFYFVGVWRGFVTSPMFPEFKDIVAKYPILLEYFAKQDKML